ncbi:MAG: TerB family tellurite resistance protein [Pseudomonadales bacterium]|nr:TerB family tellurite resistance protein [Pseudomonadales bacterium]
MLNSIKSFFEEKLSKKDSDESSSNVSSTDLASAALLIELINSDNELDDRETEEFLEVLQSSLEIPEEDLKEMVRLAEAQAHQATSLYEFTRLINDEYDYQQKLQLISNMWRIAFSDKELDKYEEHLIRKVSELIYVSHSDFIKAKLQVRDE